MQFDSQQYAHQIDFPVRFSDLDAMGHVNNARYLTYFEEGRCDWFRVVVGMEQGSLDFPVIVARIEIDYRAPIAYGKEVSVFTRCDHIGNKSLSLTGVLTVDQKPAANYRCTVVYYDYAAQKAATVPTEDAKKIRKFEPALS